MHNNHPEVHRKGATGPEKKSQNSTANTQLEKALALVTSTDVPNCISQENLFRL